VNSAPVSCASESSFGSGIGTLRRRQHPTAERETCAVVERERFALHQVGETIIVRKRTADAVLFGVVDRDMFPGLGSRTH
jgi:hypothetical protein